LGIWHEPNPDPNYNGAVDLDRILEQRPWLILAASLLICCGFWRWAQNVLVPSDTTAALRQGRPIGNNSDLYPRWLGTRELLLHGRDPYSPEITREIQIAFYGRPLDPQNPRDPIWQESFVYPLYVVFMMAPAVTVPFATAQEIFRWLLLFSIASGIPLWLRALGLRLQVRLVMAAMLLALSTSPALFEYYQQNLAALVVLFLAAGGAAAAYDWLALSGFLLALATIKPDFSGLLIAWFLVWAASRPRDRQRLLWSFALSLGGLVAAAEVISPHWMGRFLAAVAQYPAYGTDPSILQLFFPSWLATAAAAALLAFMAYICWKNRSAPAGSQAFGVATAWVVAITLTILPKRAAYNQALLIPTLLVLAAQYPKVQQAGRFTRAMVKAVALCLLWEWLSAFILALVSFFVSADKLAALAQLPEYTSIALTPVSLLALAALDPRLKKSLAAVGA